LDFPPLTTEDFTVFACDWGRWLTEPTDDMQEQGDPMALEAQWFSPQPWDKLTTKLFAIEPNCHRAQVFERLAHSGAMTHREFKVLATHWVHLSWWKLTDQEIPTTDWMRRRVRYAHAKDATEYEALLASAQAIMCRALGRYVEMLK
jgi:hypothetical protein